MSYTLADYRLAALTLWGETGAWFVDEFQRHNERYFAGGLPPLPIVFGLSAYGHCLGVTRFEGEWGPLPRITLSTSYGPLGQNVASDLLLHEMIHARLILAGEDTRHNADPWCREIMRITPLLRLPAIRAARVRTRRVNKVPQQRELPGHLSRAQLARWPHSIRPSDYPPGERVLITTY